MCFNQINVHEQFAAVVSVFGVTLLITMLTHFVLLLLLWTSGVPGLHGEGAEGAVPPAGDAFYADGNASHHRQN